MVSAFVSGTPLVVSSVSRSVSVRRNVRMSVASNVRKAALATLPAIVPMSALAAEGTGKSLGVDNVLLLVPLIVVPGIFLTLFLQFGASQDNSDFFGTTDDRRQ